MSALHSLSRGAEAESWESNNNFYSLAALVWTRALSLIHFVVLEASIGCARQWFLRGTGAKQLTRGPCSPTLAAAEFCCSVSGPLFNAFGNSD